MILYVAFISLCLFIVSLNDNSEATSVHDQFLTNTLHNDIHEATELVKTAKEVKQKLRYCPVSRRLLEGIRDLFKRAKTWKRRRNKRKQRTRHNKDEVNRLERRQAVGVHD